MSPADFLPDITATAAGESAVVLGAGLDELLRHVPQLRPGERVGLAVANKSRSLSKTAACCSAFHSAAHVCPVALI